MESARGPWPPFGSMYGQHGAPVQPMLQAAGIPVQQASVFRRSHPLQELWVVKRQTKLSKWRGKVRVPVCCASVGTTADITPNTWVGGCRHKRSLPNTTLTQDRAVTQDRCLVLSDYQLPYKKCRPTAPMCVTATGKS